VNCRNFWKDFDVFGYETGLLSAGKKNQAAGEISRRQQLPGRIVKNNARIALKTVEDGFFVDSNGVSCDNTGEDGRYSYQG
jgi:hypothetical protein